VSARPRRPLTDRQAGCLSALRRHGRWPNLWVWNNESTTRTILDALVKKGLVQRDENGVYTPTPTKGKP
jgi:DNA-binding IclR family transcriptional regulator